MSTLATELKEYFLSKTEYAQALMHGDCPWGYAPRVSTDYVESPFEIFCLSVNLDRPTLMESYGGEDMGFAYYAIWKFVREDEEAVYLKFFGWYSSYEGSEYEGLCQVFPKEVTKIEYIS